MKQGQAGIDALPAFRLRDMDLRMPAWMGGRSWVDRRASARVDVLMLTGTVM